MDCVIRRVECSIRKFINHFPVLIAHFIYFIKQIIEYNLAKTDLINQILQFNNFRTFIIILFTDCNMEISVFKEYFQLVVSQKYE